ncbi:hypothetical protein C8054_07650 [Micromonospora sp. RP3T]|nr:hypothetical protein C8054_07650 [Micromonospora sp. RP3T]
MTVALSFHRAAAPPGGGGGRGLRSGVAGAATGAAVTLAVGPVTVSRGPGRPASPPDGLRH